MLSLNLPAFDAKIAARNGKNVIFDVIRRRYVALTPEEWVRQHFVHFLLAHKGYPQALMANEVQVQLNGTKKRCDTVLYRRDLGHFVNGIEVTTVAFLVRQDYPLQHGAESGLSDCQQRASALLLPHRLRAQQLYFSAGYTRVSKLIGGATNSPLASLISSHHIPCVICGR